MGLLLLLPEFILTSVEMQVPIKILQLFSAGKAEALLLCYSVPMSNCHLEPVATTREC